MDRTDNAMRPQLHLCQPVFEPHGRSGNPADARRVDYLVSRADNLDRHRTAGGVHRRSGHKAFIHDSAAILQALQPLRLIQPDQHDRRAEYGVNGKA